MFLESGTALVRVMDKETHQRTLIREPKKEVKDLSFAYIRSDVVLGIVDGYGTTCIYTIEREQSGLSYPFICLQNLTITWFLLLP